MKKTVIVYMALAAGLAIPATVRASTYATTILADSPVLYYRLDEASGNVTAAQIPVALHKPSWLAAA